MVVFAGKNLAQLSAKNRMSCTLCKSSRLFTARLRTYVAVNNERQINKYNITT
jgi:DNA-directed RNA polymerase subunit RPC12/RpoP